MSLTPELFACNEEAKWKEYLAEHGYVVIKDVLETNDILQYILHFKKDWEKVAPNFDFNVKSTWRQSKCPMNWNMGMITSNGLGQSDFQWGLRTNQNIKEIWERLHNTKELVVSFDGFSLFLTKKQNPGTWLHIDEHPKDTLYSIQGAYNFYPVGEEDAGFMVIPGSHRATFDIKVDEDRKFIMLDENDPYTKEAVKLLIPKNSFVLWNSKTIHANTGMTKSKELNRLTSYITFFPKELRSEEIYERRKKGYLDGENCGHYAIYHHVKGKPYWDETEFERIEPRLDEEGNIPKERLIII